MRMIGLTLVVTVLGFLSSGCGQSSLKRAEKITDELISEMNQLATALETGDKASLNACLTNLNSLSKQANGIKLTKAESDTLAKGAEKKMREGNERLKTAAGVAIKSGKFTQNELLEFESKLKEINNSMKQAGW